MSDNADRTDEADASVGLRERKKQATGKALAMAALKLASERGVEGVRVEEIAAEAGVSPRTFNNYFPSKEAAIVSLVMERASQVAEKVRARPRVESLAEAIRNAYADQYTGRVPDRDRIARMRLVIGAPSLRGEYLKAAVMAERPLAAAIEARIGSEPEQVRFGRVLAAALIAVERVAVRNWMEEKGARPLALLIREAVEQVTAGARGWPVG